MKKVPCPKYEKPIPFTDIELEYLYIEFPSDVMFMESLAVNPNYKSGVAYVPVQKENIHGIRETFLYEIQPPNTIPKLLNHNQPLCTLDDDDSSTAISVFGTSLSAKGLLYLCAYNRNSILVYDLTTMTMKDEYKNIPAPNDIDLDPTNEDMLYVAGGAFRRSILGMMGPTFTNPAYGTIYKIDTRTKTTTIIQTGFNTLAGIAVLENEEIWTSQLYDIVKTSTSTKKNNTKTKVWDGTSHKNHVWLSDNIELFDEDVIMTPAYKRCRPMEARLLRSKALQSSGNFVAQLITAIQQKENWKEGLLDPEVGLNFSNSFIDKKNATKLPDPIKIAFLIQNNKDNNKNTTNTTTCDAVHVEISLKGTMMNDDNNDIRNSRTVRDHRGSIRQRHYFNDQVTHCAHILSEDQMSHGWIACVNFEQPVILLLKDDLIVQELQKKRQKSIRSSSKRASYVLSRNKSNNTNSKMDTNSISLAANIVTKEEEIMHDKDLTLDTTEGSSNNSYNANDSNNNKNTKIQRSNKNTNKNFYNKRVREYYNRVKNENMDDEYSTSSEYDADELVPYDSNDYSKRTNIYDPTITTKTHQMMIEYSC